MNKLILKKPIARFGKELATKASRVTDSEIS